MKKLFLLLSLFVYQIAFSQKAEIFKLKKFRISVLNDSIQETSGLSFFDGKLYTFNDSGNAGNLFQIDKKTGKIIRVLKTDVENKDWEALENDGKNFYIGDFGNNAGTRKDLKIYKIPFHNNQLQKDSVKVISFYYPEQKDFSSKNISTDFDLESMIYLNGKIHIFTKEWASKATTHYTIDPENSENQAANFIEKFPINYVVTDAYYFDKKLYTVGYTKKTEVFMNIFIESAPGIFFKEKPKYFYLGTAISVGQIEGIAADESGIYITGEKFVSPLGKTPPYLYFIPKDRL